MNRAARTAIVLIPLAVLVHDAASARMSVFRRTYGKEDLSVQLERAASGGHANKVMVLLQRGADANARDPEGRTPLSRAVWGWPGSAPDSVQILISKGADLNYRDKEGKTLLHQAATGNKTDVAAVLIANGLDVELSDNRGCTALHEAALSGHGGPDFLALLICKGADVNARDVSGRTPLDYANYSGPASIALLRNQGGIRACEIIPPLLDTQRDLLKAAMAHDVPAIKALLGGDVDVRATNDRGFTLLHWSALLGCSELGAALMERGADVNAVATMNSLPPDNRMETPLDSCFQYYVCRCQEGNELADVLRKRGGLRYDQMIPGHHELQRDLQKAMLAGEQQQVRELLSRPFGLETRRTDGLTLLHWAAESGFKDIVEILIEKGANVNPILHRGVYWEGTPLDLAESKQYKDVARIIRQHGGKTRKELREDGKRKETGDRRD